MLIRSGGVYPEDWKNALCIYRYSQTSDMEAKLKAYSVRLLSKDPNSLKEFADKYIAVMSLMYPSAHKDMVKAMKELSEQVRGKIVKVSVNGK